MTLSVPTSTRRTRLERHAALLVMLATALICLPFTHSVRVLADEGIWLHAARRMMGGEVPYRDFFEFYPPLSFLIVTDWIALFGSSLLAARLLVVLVVALTAGVAFSCCRRISGRAGLSALLVLAWVIGSQGFWTQISHQWMTSLFSLIALRAILSEDRGDGPPGVAGLAASAATLTTTHRGALIALAGLLVFLSRKSARHLAIYMAGGLALLAAIIGVLWWQGSLVPAFDQIVLFPLRQNAPVMRTSFGAFADLQNAFMVAAFPLAALLLVVAIVRDGVAVLRRKHWGTAGLFALAALLGCYPRPDAVHIAFCVVIALPLLAALIASLWPAGRARRLGWAVAGIVLLIPAYPLVAAMVKVVKAPRIETHAGMVGFTPRNGTVEIIRRLKDLPQRDTVFFYPYDPMLPFLTGRRDPAAIDVFVPQYSTPAQYLQTCTQVMRGADWVVYDTGIDTPEYYRNVFPAMRDPQTPEKSTFEAAMRGGFVVQAQDGDFRLLRRAGAAPSLCRDLQSRAH